MHEFDRPFFKELTPNDTPETGAKIYGVRLAKELEPFFPKLPDPTDEEPAPGITIRAALFDGNAAVGVVDTRYHYQSWGNTRSPEPRITGKLGPIRSIAKGGDLLLMERSLLDPLFFRLTLHRAGTPGYSAIKSAVGSRTSGPVDVAAPPVAEEDVIESEEQQREQETLPLELFDNDAALNESRVKRIARSKAFSRRLLPIYDYKCAVCKKGHASEKSWEVEAAHIVPRNLKGADDARNGLVLCKSHHWAFDQGLFGIRPDMKIALRPSAACDARNAHLLAFDGQEIERPKQTDPHPAAEALAWHLKNIAQIV